MQTRNCVLRKPWIEKNSLPDSHNIWIKQSFLSGFEPVVKLKCTVFGVISLKVYLGPSKCYSTRSTLQGNIKMPPLLSFVLWYERLNLNVRLENSKRFVGSSSRSFSTTSQVRYFYVSRGKDFKKVSWMYYKNSLLHVVIALDMNHSVFS